MPRPRIIALLLALITLVVYLPAGRHDFIVFDDPDYVTANRMVQPGLTLKGVTWAFTSFHASNWHPVTWLSHMLDCDLFGLNPGAQHLVNALIHAANAVLVFLLLLRLTGRLWPAAIVAALFAWHPLRVESVAWISERKDVLSLFFGLLCLLAYARYAGASAQGKQNSGNYWLALGFLALGLMAKPMLVTLPCVMLLLDWWPLHRCRTSRAPGEIKSLLVEKVPFLLLVLVSCVLTVLAQRTEAVVALERLPLSLRLENAVVAIAEYLFKTVWPVNLAVIYPLPKEISWVKFSFALLLVGGITTVAWRWRREKPHLLVGWLWFVGTLVPVIGIVQVGGQAMADRYTYLPHIGLFLAVVFEVAAWGGQSVVKSRAAAVIAGVAALLCLGATTRQLQYWQDSESLFTHTLAVTRDNPVARINLGVALEQQGRLTAARTQYEIAARLDPNRVQAQLNLANALDLTGDTAQALEHYRMALQLDPQAPLVHLNYGSALAKQGRFEEARAQYDAARRLAPADPRPWYLEGKALLRQGRSIEAVAQFQEALRLDPNHLQTLVWFARMRAADYDPRARNGAEAIQLAQHAVELTGGSDPFVLDILAAAYAEAGRFADAGQTLQRARQLLATTGDTNSAAVTTRLQLYQRQQPYRESFTNAP